MPVDLPQPLCLHLHPPLGENNLIILDSSPKFSEKRFDWPTWNQLTMTGRITWTIEMMSKQTNESPMYTHTPSSYMLPISSTIHILKVKHWQSEIRKVRPCMSVVTTIKGLCVKHPISELLSLTWWYQIHNIWKYPADSFFSSPFSKSLEERDVAHCVEMRTS